MEPGAAGDIKARGIPYVAPSKVARTPLLGPRLLGEPTEKAPDREARSALLWCFRCAFQELFASVADLKGLRQRSKGVAT